jgi:hypothetical protein
VRSAAKLRVSNHASFGTRPSAAPQDEEAGRGLRPLLRMRKQDAALGRSSG